MDENFSKKERNKFVKPTAYLLFIITIYVICEVSIRIIYPDRILPLDERNNLYEYNDTLGWFPIKNQTTTFKGSVEIKVEHNKDGFRDINHGLKTKKRIMFLGDSFTWGYDVEVNERFSNLLQEKIDDWELLNCGVSGYGTDQAFILLQNNYEKYKPDIVFLTFSSNDKWENKSKVIYGGYYKPYFVNKEEGIKVEGIPVQKSYRYLFSKYPIMVKSRTLYVICRSLHELMASKDLEIDPTKYILTAMEEYIENKGGRLIIGFVDEDANKEEIAWCNSNDIDYLTLTTTKVFPSKGNHWTSEGHKFVAEKIFTYFINEQSQFFGKSISK